MSRPEDELPRVLGFRDLLFIAMGQIIGAGVVALTGVAIGMTGPSVVLAYVLAALLSLAVSLPIVIAGGTLPTVGAYYVWCSRLGGAWMGSGVLMLILLASISLALYGSSFGLYLNPILPFLSVIGWGFVIVIGLFGANLFGLQIAAGVQSFLVLVLLSALAIYAGFAAPELNPARFEPLFPNGWAGFASAVLLLTFATGGAHLVVGLGGETKDAAHTIPRVIVSATLLVALFYAGVALAAVGVVPWQEMVDQPLTVAGRAFLPGWAMTYFLVGGAGVAIGTTLNAQFIQLPRNFMVAAWDGLLPSFVGQLNRRGAPWVILSAMGIIGLVPLIAGLDISAIARADSGGVSRALCAVAPASRPRRSLGPVRILRGDGVAGGRAARARSTVRRDRLAVGRRRRRVRLVPTPPTDARAPRGRSRLRDAGPGHLRKRRLIGARPAHPAAAAGSSR